MRGSFTSTVNGSRPVSPYANHATMIPMPSYHESSFVSSVAVIESLSTLCTSTFQLSGVADIVTSHETGPAGSEEWLTHEKRCTVSVVPAFARSVGATASARCRYM